MKQTLTILKNLYTNEIVHCINLNDVPDIDGNIFVRVFKPENPERTFLVNYKAFNVIK